LESGRVEVCILDSFLVVIAAVSLGRQLIVHFNTIQELLIAILGDEEKVSLASGLSIFRFRIFDDWLHQFDVLRLLAATLNILTLLSLPAATGILGTQA
jgi:hypothetical protein